MKKLLALCLMTLSLFAMDTKHLASSITTGQAGSETPHVQIVSSSVEAKTAWKLGATTNLISIQKDTASINTTKFRDSIIDYKMIVDPFKTEIIDVKPFINVRRLEIAALAYDEQSGNAGVYIKPNILKGALQYKFSYGYDNGELQQTIERHGLVGGYKTEGDVFVFLYSYEIVKKSVQDDETLLQMSAELKMSDNTAIIAKHFAWKNDAYWYNNTFVGFKIYIK